jgi:hypothetical protein
MKTITITLAAILALTSCLSAAQGTDHQKKPALGRRPAHQSADIARPVFARRNGAVQNDTQHELEQLVWRGQRRKRVPRQTSCH